MEHHGKGSHSAAACKKVVMTQQHGKKRHGEHHGKVDISYQRLKSSHSTAAWKKET